MRLRQIEVFHAIYSSGSMTNAARMLNVSQPSISKVLAHAEQQLGYPLFDRVKGKLVATPEAHRLFGLVAGVFEHVDQLRHVAENLRSSDAGKIRVAATPAFGVDLLPSAVATFLGGRPETVFEIETLHHDEIAEALLESRIDVGLAFDPVLAPGLTEEHLAVGEFVVITSPEIGFGGKSMLTVGDLAELPFISLSGRGPLGRLLTTYLDNCGVQLKKIVFTETYHVAKALVAKGGGVTIVDAITARSAGHSDVKRWPLDPPLPFSVSCIKCDRMPLSVLSRRFIDHLRRTIVSFLQ